MASSHNHLKMDTISAEFVYSLVVKGWSYRDISEHLQSMYPHIQRGLSERSVRRFCCDHGITKLKGSDLNKVVEGAITEVSGLFFCQDISTLTFNVGWPHLWTLDDERLLRIKRNENRGTQSG